MDKRVNIAFIGGDERASWAADYFCHLGHEVGCYGCQSNIGASAVKIGSLGDALVFSDAVILPIPVSRDGKTVAYSQNVMLSQILEGISRDKKIIVAGGMIQKKFGSMLEGKGVTVLDYGANEQYLQRSAKLTVLAFGNFIKDNKLDVLENKRLVICGLGRIGKELVNSLGRLNTQINVLSSKCNEYSGRYPENVRFYGYNEAKSALHCCDAVINTAPAHVLNFEDVKSIPENAVFYELASAPFGIDDDSVKYLRARYVKALGLPGKYYPKESGELIAMTVTSEL